MLMQKPCSGYFKVQTMLKTNNVIMYLHVNSLPHSLRTTRPIALFHYVPFQQSIGEFSERTKRVVVSLLYMSSFFVFFG